MKYLLLMPLFAFVVSCGNNNGHEMVTKEGADPVVELPGEHDAMNAAKDKARETMSYFIENWQNPENESASIKIGVPAEHPDDPDYAEHIWFSPIKFEGDKVTAECGNSPQNVPDLKLGDVQTYDMSLASDWMIVRDGKTYGGYTLRVILKLNPDAAGGMNFEFVDP